MYCDVVLEYVFTLYLHLWPGAAKMGTLMLYKNKSEVVMPTNQWPLSTTAVVGYCAPKGIKYYKQECMRYVSPRSIRCNELADAR